MFRVVGNAVRAATVQTSGPMQVAPWQSGNGSVLGQMYPGVVKWYLVVARQFADGRGCVGVRVAYRHAREGDAQVLVWFRVGEGEGGIQV